MELAPRADTLSNEMTRPLNSARLIAVGRRVVPWVVGPVALMIGGRPLELASPSACPGGLELMSIASVRLDPDLGIGAVFAGPAHGGHRRRARGVRRAGVSPVLDTWGWRRQQAWRSD